MWKTRDGKQLRVLRSDLGKLSFRARRNAVAPDRRGHAPAKPDFSIIRPLKRLVKGARQIGILRRPNCDCTYGVFASKLGQRDFRILSRPLPDGGNAIISIRIGLGSI